MENRPQKKHLPVQKQVQAKEVKPPAEVKPAAKNVVQPKTPSRIVRQTQTVKSTASGKHRVRDFVPPTQQQEEIPPERTLKPKGIPIKIKFALFTAVVVVLASLTMSFMLFVKVKTQINDEINSGGTKLVNILSSIEPNYWKNIGTQTDSVNPGTEKVELADKVIKSVDGLLNEYILVSNELISKIKKEEKEEFQQELDRLKKEKEDVKTEIKQTIVIDVKKIVGRNPLTYVKDIVKDEIVDILIYQDQGAGGVQRIAGMLTQALKIKTTPIKVTRDGIKISEGVYDSPNGSILVREFEKEIDKDEGIYISAFLSARRISESKSALIYSLFIGAIFSIGLGAIVGFFVANSVTRPINILLQDINIVSSGDLEHQTKARSSDEIGVLAETFDRMTKSLKQAHQAELENKAREHELNIASEIQSNLLPKKIPRYQGYELGAYYRPSKEVGGDYYDFIEIDENHLGIVVADVSGKGIPGSMVMTMGRSLMRMEAERNLSSADTLKKVNKILARDIKKGMFITCMYCILNIKERTLFVSSAGHNPMIVVRNLPQKSIELVNPNGIVLGMDRGPVFDSKIKEQEVKLNKGDRIVLYTDGVVEAMNENKELFTEKRFCELVKALSDKDSNQLISIVINQLDEHKGSAEQHDDITIITLRVV